MVFEIRWHCRHTRAPLSLDPPITPRVAVTRPVAPRRAAGQERRRQHHPRRVHQGPPRKSVDSAAARFRPLPDTPEETERVAFLVHSEQRDAKSWPQRIACPAVRLGSREPAAGSPSICTGTSVLAAPMQRDSVNTVVRSGGAPLVGGGADLRRAVAERRAADAASARGRLAREVPAFLRGHGSRREQDHRVTAPFPHPIPDKRLASISHGRDVGGGGGCVGVGVWRQRRR
jgi:hypothetical protein